MAERKGKPGETLAFDFAKAFPVPRAPSPPPASVPLSAPLQDAPASAPLPTFPVASPAAPPASASPASASPASASPAATPQGPRVLTVAQLGRAFSRVLERTFVDAVFVEGEVSGARHAGSGHVYFSLKDEEEDATLDVVLYRSSLTPRARTLIKDGARVRVRGKPTYWSPRGKLQFVGDKVEPTGKGALLEALEKLKEKLQAEGLFAAEKKRALPADPRVVGVVTSATGAVIHDICKVAFRRGGARILLAAAQVQGSGAAESIRRALKMLQRIERVDVIILGRGGGSTDDLLAFNDEQLVRDVAACRVPIVSAVGHEVDVTLVDFAADARAATPSQAAEMCVPDNAARARLLEERSARLRRAIAAKIAEDRVLAGKLARAFGDPRLLIAAAQQRIDEHVARLERLALGRLARERDGLAALSSRLGAAHPRERIAHDRATVAEISAHLAVVGRSVVVRQRRDELTLHESKLSALGSHLARDRAKELGALAARLDAMSPLKVLGRGYAIVTAEDGRAVRAASEVKIGDALRVRVAAGELSAKVTRVEEEA